MTVTTGEPIEAIQGRYDGQGYGAFKSEAAESVIALLDPIQRRFHEVRDDPGELQRLLALGAEKARAASQPTLDAMYERMGFVRLGRDRPRPAEPQPPRRQLSPLSDREPFDVERRVASASEAAHGVSDGLAHPLHLAVPTLVECELESGPVRPAAQDADACRCGRAVVELDAIAEPGDDVG